MSKQIYVQAQADHIESLFQAAPRSAEDVIFEGEDA